MGRMLGLIAVAASCLEIALPLRFPIQPALGALWLAATTAAFVVGRRTQTRPWWLLLLVPFALGKTIVGLAILFSCTFNYPAGCP